jgi:RND family efflux transporter MFP subunit
VLVAMAACALITAMALPPAAHAQQTDGAKKADSPKAGAGGARQGRKGGRRGRRAVVQLDQVRRIALTQTVPVLGRMVARQTGVVAARIAGPVGTMAVQVGDRVKKGDVLAVLVSDSLRWRRELVAGEVAKYEGVAASAKARQAKAKNELRRLGRLRKSVAFSQARYEDQLREVENLAGEVMKASAELRQARASLKLAEINLYNARIRAPYAGVVTRRHTEVGAYVNVGAPVVTLINDTEMEIEADVPSSRLGGIRPGVVLNVELEDKSARKAIVRAVVPDENPLARTRAVRFTPDFRVIGQNMAANQTVVLHVPVGAAREVLSVHKDAVLQRGGGAVVFVIEERKARIRRIRLGEAVGGRFEVLEGVKAGDMAVVRGNERLREGQRVRVRGGGE